MANITSLVNGADADIALSVPDGLSCNYRRLRELIDQAAGELLKAGVEPGGRVALAFPNSPEALIFFLAAAAIGTACPLNPAYTETEFRFFLEDTGASFLLVPTNDGVAARKALPPGARLLEAQITADGLHLNSSNAPTPSPTLPTRGRERSSASPSLPTKGMEATDVALVLHTSGTTSRPKRVPLRHRNLITSVDNIGKHYQLTPRDVSLCIMPLFHVHGLVASTLATLASGGRVVVPEKFTPLGFWPIARQVKPTWFSASPTPHQMILMRGSEERPPGTERLRFVRSCSAALAPSLMSSMETRFGVPVLEAYGMTEASHQMTSNPLPPGRRYPGSVGVGTGVQVAVLDERGTSLVAGATGQVGIRGANVIDGYENNPEANASSFINGWFLTGDQGTLDSAGYLRLLGRIKELINRGGEKIAPREIDETLELHPRVKEAVAFGVPHPTWGEEVSAAVVVEGEVSEKELQAHCRQTLADFKVPRRIHIVDSIPRTPTGKVQRRFVAEQFIPK
ncbi:MAG TPA: acyl--CoA ligase [Candidatus Dormibacteraeota bacterium]|nr:acyl--CoA ligase [Candidatus Dormibacteraeota bacterium]